MVKKKSSHHDVVFGIGGTARPSIEVGRKGIIQDLKSRNNLNGTICIVKKKLKNGRIAIEVSNNSLEGTEYEDKEIIAVLPTKLDMIWEIPNRQDANDHEIDDELCPICIDTSMITNESSSRFSCCGGQICNKCFIAINLRSNNPNRCPLCRADTTDCSNEAEIAKIRERANRGNDANAMYNLGGYYDYGQYGVIQDQKIARYWYKKAAVLGEVRAAQNLGCSLRDGDGGSIDLVEAAKYFKLAADGGHIQGITNLGLCYMMGHGVPVNLKKAEKLLKQSSNRGDQLAVQQLQTLEFMKSMPKNNPNITASFM